MRGRVEGKVAFITGAARGQGRSHAVRLAQEGADIIAVDLCEPIPTVTPEFYDGATEEDLEETVRQVEALDRRIYSVKADVRDYAALKAALDAGVAELGRLDIAIANAGIFTFGHDTDQVTDDDWDNIHDINLKGVWHTAKAAMPHLKQTGLGASLTLISSLAGTKGLANVAAYTAAKHGVVGLMKVLANELGPYGVRVNSIHPNAMATNMVMNEATYKLFRPELEHPTFDDAKRAAGKMNSMGVDFMDPSYVSNAILYLSSDEALWVNGVQLAIDGGAAVL
jgi:SDR family mycofactocin-dependent oxidoreductase